MGLAKKKKLAKRERLEQLKEREKFVQARLRASAEVGESENQVEYILPPDECEVSTALPSSATDGSTDFKTTGASNNNNRGHDAEDEDRVQLPSVTVSGATKATAARVRRRQKMSWEALKLAVAERYGMEISRLVGEHDGNAEDPFFTVQMKAVRRTVPVPRHWSQLRAFLTNQTDRERATNIVPPEIAALGVERIRATRDKKANPDQVAFVTCFISGTPLRRKKFNVNLSRFGDVFYEDKWVPKTHHEPGVLSQRLRAALGMGPHSPPPWLYGMQSMRRLPPAYQSLRVPGLNAPIPPGAQWGNGEGQWGQPPRNENNTFLFPGVMDEVSTVEAPPVYWGTVPPLLTSESMSLPVGDALPQHLLGATTDTTTATAHAKPMTAAQTTPKPIVTAVPFHPQAYKPATAMRYTPSVPQEYVRVQDNNTAGATVAVASTYVPKKAAFSSQQPAERSQPQQRPTKKF